jgi:hypothetical protein
LPLRRRSGQDLHAGLDFRKVEYRREVFLRFYEFHLKYRSHPGCVYFVMPWLAEKHSLDQEQKLWLAFLNGNTQNIITSWMIFERFPSPADSKGLPTWFEENYDRLAFDTDRRYHRKDFLRSVECYRKLTDGSQVDYFASVVSAIDEEAGFDQLWPVLRKDFYTFGRLSAFSYSEYLRLMGVPINCSTLFLNDMEGSKSHRNGLAKVLGRDDLDWHKESGFNGDYAEGDIPWLTVEAATLLAQARTRLKEKQGVDPDHVNYFTLESALCTYKSWHRKNRRYPNCYVDMMLDRILVAERNFGTSDVAQFRRCRAECLPAYLRRECCPYDPGLVPVKQNHYRDTGEVIMMSRDFPEFDNSFDRMVWSCVLE